MEDYTVDWKVTVAANSHREAAKIALDMMKQEGSTACYFGVLQEDTGTHKNIDLLEADDDD